jgi:molybdopterin molybdotransferase
MNPPAPASPEAAIAAICSRCRAVGTERIDLSLAPGRILAEDLPADRPSPALDISAMDGYAVRTGEFRTAGADPVRLSVWGEAVAGCPPLSLSAGGAESGAVRIMTGAPVPAGADAVVRREDVREDGGWIEIEPGIAASIRQGDNIRGRGENIRAGATVVGAGRPVTAAVCGALAAFGAVHPLVHRRVRAAVVVTGDEVLDPRAVPEPWQIRDSNGASLAALLTGHAWLEVCALRRARDDRDALCRALADALEGTDALIITGGVSMGDRDYVPGVLRCLGAEVLFHKLPQRPGKPVLGAVIDGPGGSKPVLALPGNPVSVMVTARRMLAPVLAFMAGVREQVPPPLVRLRDHDGKRLGLWWHRPVRLVGPGVATLVPGMGSGDIAAAARSDGFIEFPPGPDGGAAGDDGPWPFYSWGFS